MKQRIRSWLTPLLLTLSSHSFGAMSLDRMIVYFEADEAPRQDIVVSNPDNENLYLQTEVYKVINPGSENEERVRITNPAEMKLLSTPGKAIIAPGSRKTVRLVSLETPEDIESVYRVTFRPVVGDIKATQNAIKLLIAYQALVFIRPENARYDVSARREKDSITFTNSGNMNVVLRNGRFCTGNGDAKKCNEIKDGTRLYAGQSWSLKLPSENTSIEYGLFNGEREQRKVF